MNMNINMMSKSPQPAPPRPASPAQSLEVYKRNYSNGRIMVCEAREQHCSVMKEGFAGRPNRERTKAVLRDSLEDVFGRLGNQEHGRKYLVAATVGFASLA